MNFEAGERSWNSRHTALPPEVVLWLAVIAKARADVRSVNASLNRAQARQFLRGTSGFGDMLNTILVLLDLDPGWWQRSFRPALEAEWRAREPFKAAA